MRASCFVVLGICVVGRAFAQPNDIGFVHGHVYVTESWYEHGCFDGVPQYIREIDPATGESWILADIGDGLCDPTGLVFTPSGKLRVGNYSAYEIMDFDSAGVGEVVYLPSDGLIASGNKNGLAFDAEGSFYTLNNGGFYRLLKFAGDQRPSSVFADVNDGLGGSGALAFHPDGRLFVAQSTAILAFDSSGAGSVFDPLPPPADIKTLVVSSAGDLYVIARNPALDYFIYEYANADPASKRELAMMQPFMGIACLRLSPDESELYFLDEYTVALYAIDVENGAMRTVFEFDFVSTVSVGLGMAVYVAPTPPFTPGDLNCDGSVNAFDINPFILALIDAEDYAAAYPACEHALADVNADGSVNPFDIQAFVELLGTP